MDTSDPNIVFDDHGVCSHCYHVDRLMAAWNFDEKIRENQLGRLFERIHVEGKGSDFDCIMGVSGGVDSSFVAMLASKYGLRPLCVHLDNGWNSELATANIRQIITDCGFELFTHVLDWEEFRDLQRSFFKSDVVDLELLTDHAIFGVILQLARKFKLKTILSGANISTESVMPAAWVHRKQDLKNILAIHREYGSVPLRTFPRVSTLQHVFAMAALGYDVQKPLNLMQFEKAKAKSQLQDKFGWRDYGGKHYESVFTKFYQAHILPTKFGIDKRKAHLSSLILSGQMDRPSAIVALGHPLYDPAELEVDTAYVCKKLGFTRQEMQDYLQRPARSHFDFASDQRVYEVLSTVRKFMTRLRF